jgi:hypothetical protein
MKTLICILFHWDAYEGMTFREDPNDVYSKIFIRYRCHECGRTWVSEY